MTVLRQRPPETSTGKSAAAGSRYRPTLGWTLRMHWIRFQINLIRAVLLFALAGGFLLWWRLG
jgi:hypothetical protein